MKARTLGVILAGILAVSACTVPDGDSSLSATAVPALAPAAPVAPKAALDALVLTKPMWQVGDQWRYSDDYALRVSEVNGPLAKFERADAPSQWFVANGFFREKMHSASSTRQIVFRSENPDRFYTAPIGKPVVFVREYLRDKQLVRHQTSWVVEGKERITVPAGTFDTFVIVMRTRSLTGSWTGFERWWYAPAVRNYVRIEYKYGQSPESARVLVNYSLGN